MSVISFLSVSLADSASISVWTRPAASTVSVHLGTTSPGTTAAAQVRGHCSSCQWTFRGVCACGCVYDSLSLVSFCPQTSMSVKMGCMTAERISCVWTPTEGSSVWRCGVRTWKTPRTSRRHRCKSFNILHAPLFFLLLRQHVHPLLFVSFEQTDAQLYNKLHFIANNWSREGIQTGQIRQTKP